MQLLFLLWTYNSLIELITAKEKKKEYMKIDVKKVTFLTWILFILMYVELWRKTNVSEHLYENPIGAVGGFPTTFRIVLTRDASSTSTDVNDQ